MLRIGCSSWFRSHYGSVAGERGHQKKQARPSTVHAMSFWEPQLWSADGVQWTWNSVDVVSDSFRSVDITSELSYTATEALGILKVLDCRWLQWQLAKVVLFVQHVVEVMNYMWQQSGGDDLERCAVAAWLAIDAAIWQKAPPLPAPAIVEHLKALSIQCMDIVVLLRSRFLCETVLQTKGIHPELLRRLDAAFGQVNLQDVYIWSRLIRMRVGVARTRGCQI